jgi:hypothetical protein
MSVLPVRHDGRPVLPAHPADHKPPRLARGPGAQPSRRRNGSRWRSRRPRRITAGGCWRPIRRRCWLHRLGGRPSAEPKPPTWPRAKRPGKENSARRHGGICARTPVPIGASSPSRPDTPFMIRSQHPATDRDSAHQNDLGTAVASVLPGLGGGAAQERDAVSGCRPGQLLRRWSQPFGGPHAKVRRRQPDGATCLVVIQWLFRLSQCSREQR